MLLIYTKTNKLTKLFKMQLIHQMLTTHFPCGTYSTTKYHTTVVRKGFRQFILPKHLIHDVTLVTDSDINNQYKSITFTKLTLFC